ncbi:MAG: hypothetical protein AAF558_09345 [Verrucomicrobiota bacterium]
MNAYRCRQWALITFLGLMFLIGELALSNSKGNYEFFPFYSWSMFALVPNEEKNYQVMIHRVGSHTLDPPIDFREAGSFAKNPGALPAYHVIQKLGKSLEAGDIDTSKKLRNHLESTYLQPNTSYEVMKQKEDPLKLWKKQNRGLSYRPEQSPVAQFKTAP